MKHIRNALLVSLSLFLISPQIQADLSKKHAEALEQTKELLKSAQKRNSFIKDNTDAQKADDSVDQLVNTLEQKQKIYEMASEIFEQITKSNDGDASKMNNLLQKAMKDPKSFYKSLSKKIQTNIRGLASELEEQKGTKKTP